MVIELATHKILKDLKDGNYLLRSHALDMMVARKLTNADIVRIAETCAEFAVLGNGLYRVSGIRLNGRGIAIVCKIENKTVIITVMKRRVRRRK